MVKMKTPFFIRSISLKLSNARGLSSQVVVPLPEETQFLQQVTAKLNDLQSSNHDVGSANWLGDVLDATISTQKLAQESLSTSRSSLSEIDKEMIDDYLDDNVQLLDACNGLVEKIDLIQKYASSLKAITRSIRVGEVLNKCDKLEKECAKLDKCNPKLNRLIGQKKIQVNSNSYELHEAISLSNEVALVSCHRLQRALSFKSRQGLVKMKSKISTSSNSLNDLLVGVQEGKNQNKRSSHWMMNELEELIIASRMFHDQVKSHDKNNVEIDLFKRRCEALEEDLKFLQERVGELYRHLISIRMTLLGMISQS